MKKKLSLAPSTKGDLVKLVLPKRKAPCNSLDTFKGVNVCALVGELLNAVHLFTKGTGL